MRRPDPILMFVGACGGATALFVAAWLIAMFVSVIFGGGSSECPQSLCL